MEVLFFELFSVEDIDWSVSGIAPHDRRSLIEEKTTVNEVVPRWKESVWDRNSVEPAMLRVPIVLLTFIVLWGLNIIIFDRFKLQYHGVMSIKTSKFPLMLEGSKWF